MVQEVIIGAIIAIIIFFILSKLVFFGFVFAIVGIAFILINMRVNGFLSVFIAFFIVWILFLNVNPYDFNMNKLTVLENIPKKYLTKQGLLTKIKDPEYPIILKPVRCTALSRGIIFVENSDKLKRLDKTILDNKEYMYQKYIDWKYEAGVLYEYGNIVSVVRKDGNEKIRAYCKKCTDITFEVSGTFKNSIKQAASQIPNFNVGRFDIRYKNDSELQKGNFIILEANGTLGFDLRKTTYNFLVGGSFTIRWIIIRLLYGFYNIISFNGYNPIKLIQVMCITLYNTWSCRDWEKLFALYT